MEIKANDLRIGNYVSRYDLGNLNLRHEKVLQLLEDKAVISGPIKVICKYSDLKPLPITEQLLLEFGFEFFGGMTGWIIDNHSINQFDGVFEFFINKENPIKLQYAHQLQNLYFALTNQELIKQ